MTALNLSFLTAFTPATSESYTFSVTQADVIKQSMLDNGVLSEGELPTGQEFADMSRKLNMLVKQWMGNTDFAPGLKVWTRRRATLFLGNTQYTYRLGQTGDHWVESTTGLSYPQQYGQRTVVTTTAAGQLVLPVSSVVGLNINDYVGVLLGSDIFWSRVVGINAVAPLSLTLATPLPQIAQAGGASYVWNYTKKAVRPLTIITAVLRDIYANDIPLDFLTVQRYESLPTKVSPTNIADPTSLLYESQFKNQEPNGRLYLDVGGAQDVTKNIHAVFLAPVQDLLRPGDAVDYPQQWYRALCWGLARDSCGMFDVPWSQTNESNYTDSLAIARQMDPETTDVYFEPNAGSPWDEGG